MKCKLKPGVPETPEVTAWLEKVNAKLLSDEDTKECVHDMVFFGATLIRTDAQGKMRRVPPKEWNK